MSTEKFLRAFGNIKDEYIIEATCIGEAAAVNGAPKPENAKKSGLNKKIKIILPIAACICLIATGIIGCYSLFFAPSNGEKPNESKYKDTDLYEVFAEASSMSASPFSGVTRKWSILPEEIADESVPKEIDYEIDGETVHLILDYSVRTGWSKQKDDYNSEDKKIYVSFDHTTGRMVAFGRKQDNTDTSDELSDEELLKVAENFVLEKWPMLKDNFNIVGFTKYNTSNKVAIYVHQTVNGRGTNNAVDLYLTKQGNIIEWIERMVYPEGIPDNIQEA
ncbi:MAG: hypothetical protein KBT31_06985, partial [Firmicutes bacterium]|nr:hypothetical protein [Candidatus Colimorpha enterica]